MYYKVGQWKEELGGEGERAMAGGSSGRKHSWAMSSGMCWAGSGHTQSLPFLAILDHGERQTLKGLQLEGNMFSSCIYVWAQWNYGVGVTLLKKSPAGQEGKQVFFGAILSCWGCCISIAEPGSHADTERGGKPLGCQKPDAGAGPPPILKKPACLRYHPWVETSSHRLEARSKCELLLLCWGVAVLYDSFLSSYWQNTPDEYEQAAGWGTVWGCLVQLGMFWWWIGREWGAVSWNTGERKEGSAPCQSHSGCPQGPLQHSGLLWTCEWGPGEHPPVQMRFLAALKLLRASISGWSSWPCSCGARLLHLFSGIKALDMPPGWLVLGWCGRRGA